jgi:hypothetical protein
MDFARLRMFTFWQNMLFSVERPRGFKVHAYSSLPIGGQWKLGKTAGPGEVFLGLGHVAGGRPARQGTVQPLPPRSFGWSDGSQTVEPRRH